MTDRSINTNTHLITDKTCMSLFKSKRQGNCAYCHRFTRKLTKEHVVPKCVGGVYTIRVCEACNNQRGDSLTYPPFVAWRKAHPSEFDQAVQTSTDPVQTAHWLTSNDP